MIVHNRKKMIWDFINSTYLNSTDNRDYLGYPFSRYVNGLLIRPEDNFYQVAFASDANQKINNSNTIMFKISKNYKLSTTWSDELLDSSDGVVYEIDSIQLNGSAKSIDFLEKELTPFIRDFKIKELGI